MIKIMTFMIIKMMIMIMLIMVLQYRVEKEFSGRGYAPYDPTHNSTSLYTR